MLMAEPFNLGFVCFRQLAPPSGMACPCVYVNQGSHYRHHIVIIVINLGFWWVNYFYLIPVSPIPMQGCKGVAKNIMYIESHKNLSPIGSSSAGNVWADLGTIQEKFCMATWKTWDRGRALLASFVLIHWPRNPKEENKPLFACDSII